MDHGRGISPKQLDQTPTWAVACVCAVIVIVSIVLEKIIHRFGEFFKEKRKRALVEALEKIKGELMVLGFISLLLTFFQNYISQVCMPMGAANTMLPCPAHHQQVAEANPMNREEPPKGGHHRKLLWYERRILRSFDTESSSSDCREGFVQLISLDGLHQLHIFIFFLAVFHVMYSCMTMLLGRLKIRRWKYWEKDNVNDYEFSNDPTRFRLTHETSFVRDHTSFWTKNPFLFYLVCFYRQFFRSVRRADYLTMRHGFITVHLAPGSKFDFQKYIMRSLEDDFKVVVGISPLLWAASVIFLLLNVHGWQTMFWATVAPLIVILAVGTKLQAIITQMAIEIHERHAVVQGIPLVQVSDRHFWFGWPQLILHLIHFTLFQYEFGLKSCFNDNLSLMIARITIGVGVQFLCSYITLPLYSLVTQMGSTMKRSIFDEQTSKALKKWHMNAMKKADGKQQGGLAVRTLGGSIPEDDETNHPVYEMEDIALSPMNTTPPPTHHHLLPNPLPPHHTSFSFRSHLSA